MLEKETPKQIDVENFFVIYNKTLFKALEEKDTLLERFKDVERELKNYLILLSDLEKLKNEINLELFNNELNDFIQILMNFNPEDMQYNIEALHGGILHLKSIQFELIEISKKYFNIVNFWNEFAINKYNLDSNSKIYKDIQYILQDIKNDLSNASINDFSRLEEKINLAKKQIERSISIISFLKEMINKYIFIGEKEIQFLEKVENFLLNDYKTKSLGEIAIITEELDKEFKEIESNSETEFKKIPVLKVISKTGNAYSYVIEPKEKLYLNVADIEIDNPEYININRFIYIDNYPKHGIFSKDFLLNDMEVPTKYFDMIKEFDSKTLKYFILISSLIFLIIFLFVIGIFSLFQLSLFLILMPILFITLFNKTKNDTNKKYHMRDAFHFYQSNYLIVSEGDPLFKPQNITPLILMNFSKIFNTKLSKLTIENTQSNKGKKNARTN